MPKLGPFFQHAVGNEIKDFGVTAYLKAHPTAPRGAVGVKDGKYIDSDGKFIIARTANGRMGHVLAAEGAPPHVGAALDKITMQKAADEAALSRFTGEGGRAPPTPMSREVVPSGSSYFSPPALRSAEFSSPQAAVEATRTFRLPPPESRSFFPASEPRLSLPPPTAPASRFTPLIGTGLAGAAGAANIYAGQSPSTLLTAERNKETYGPSRPSAAEQITEAERTAVSAPYNLGISIASDPETGLPMGPGQNTFQLPPALSLADQRPAPAPAPAPRPVQTDARRYEANGSPLPPSRPADLNSSSNILNRIFSGKDFQSNAREVMDNGKVNWGDSDSAADFFRASKAKMANPEASGENNTDLGMKRGGSIKGLTSHDVLHKALEVIHHMLTRGR